jgi:hypothetical protein
LNALVFSEIREVERGDQSLGQCIRELITEMASCDSSETKGQQQASLSPPQTWRCSPHLPNLYHFKLKGEKERKRTIE